MFVYIYILNFRVDPSKDMVNEDDTTYEPVGVDAEASDDPYISAKDDDDEDDDDEEDNDKDDDDEDDNDEDGGD